MQCKHGLARFTFYDASSCCRGLEDDGTVIKNAKQQHRERSSCHIIRFIRVGMDMVPVKESSKMPFRKQ